MNNIYFSFDCIFNINIPSSISINIQFFNVNFSGLTIRFTASSQSGNAEANPFSALVSQQFRSIATWLLLSSYFFLLKYDLHASFLA